MSASNNSDHTQPMSCADLSEAAGLPAVEIPTIESLQAEITQLKEKARRQEDLFFKLTISTMLLTKAAIDNLMNILEKSKKADRERAHFRT